VESTEAVRQNQRFPIIGTGASAGGLMASQKCLENMPLVSAYKKSTILRRIKGRMALHQLAQSELRAVRCKLEILAITTAAQGEGSELS
jgi:hypothetical protein